MQCGTEVKCGILIWNKVVLFSSWGQEAGSYTSFKNNYVVFVIKVSKLYGY